MTAPNGPILPEPTGLPEPAALALLDLAAAHRAAGDLDTARQLCRDAAAGTKAAAGAVLARAALLFPDAADERMRAEIHGLCVEALALAEPGDTGLRGQLQARADSTANRWTSRAPLVPDDFRDSVEDPVGTLTLLQAEHTRHLNPRFAAVRQDLALRALRVGLAAGSRDAVVWGRCRLVDSHWEYGRRVEMDSELAALDDLAMAADDAALAWWLDRVRASVALLEGRFAAAERLAETARDLGRSSGQDPVGLFDQIFRNHLGELRTTDLAGVEAFVREYLVHGPLFARAWLASVLLAAGRQDEAVEEWRQVSPHLPAFPDGTAEWVVNCCSSVAFTELLSDAPTAERDYATLLPYDGLQAVAGAHTPGCGPVALALGRLALVRGDTEAAIRHLDAAIAQARAVSATPFEAVALFARARAESRRSARAPDRHGVRTYADESLRLARRLGMEPLSGQVEGFLAGTGHGRLSPRELEIARLVAAGRTNRVIGQDLHLSERTVESHVTHVLRKLAVDSRAAVAAWVAGGGRD